MPRRMRFETFGLGLNTNGARGPTGHSRVSRNLHHNRGPNRAVLREGTMRVWATKTEAPVWNIFEFFNASGTAFRLDKCNDELETFSLTAATAKTNLQSSFSTSGPADIAEAMDLAFITDQRAGNYVTNGSTVRTLGRSAPTSALSPTETSAGAATGFGTGTYYCCYTFYNPTFDMESPPRAAESVTKANANTGIRVTTPADPGSGYTTMRFYRTKVGELGPFYLAGTSTSFGSTFDYLVLDASLGFSSYPKSTLHNDDGDIVSAQAASAKFACWHKGYLHLLSESSHLIRDFWSDLFKPCQFFVYTIAQSPAMYHDLELGQGRIATGMNSLNGSLVYFKDYSITVKNGDVDPSTWTWNVVVDGIGCVAPWTRALAPNIGIFFCGHDGIYLFDLTSVTKISDKPNGTGIGDDYRALDFSKIEKWWGIWNEQTREYWLGVTTSNGTYPDRIYVYAHDSGAWATIELGMANLYASCAGIVTNSSGQRRVYLGLSDGYALQTGLVGSSTQRDGPISGTVTGTVTSVTGNHLNDSGASFYTTGDKLTGLVVTLRYSTGTYQSQLITGSTGTQIQVGSSWTGTPTGATYFVGAIQGTLALDQWDDDNAGPKRFHEVNLTVAKQTHSIPVRVGFTLDDDTIPTYGGTEYDCKDIRISSPVMDHGTQIGPYVDTIGTDHPLEVTLVEVDYDRLGTRRPSN